MDEEQGMKSSDTYKRMLPFGTVTGPFLGMKLSCFKWIHYLQTSFFLKKHSINGVFCMPKVPITCQECGKELTDNSKKIL